MARITFDENFIYLHGVLPSDKSMLEIHHNATFYQKSKMWRLPLNLSVLTELWNTFKELRGDPQFEGLGFRLKKERDDLLSARVNVASFWDPEGKLRQYQYEDMGYLACLTAGGIFNEPRTGKTPVSIRLMKLIGGKRNLIVCPASLIYNWKAEVEQWWPEAGVMVYTTDKNVSPPTGFNGVVIVSKDTLKLRLSAFDDYRWDTMFVDEAHFLRNYDSAQAKAVFKIEAARRYAITGTPTVNHPSDIWGILRYLYPKKYPAVWQFHTRYFQTYDSQHHKGQEVGWPKPARVKEMQELIGMISVQRKRTEVMPWLPKKQYKPLLCHMGTKQKALYQEMKQFFTATDFSGITLNDQAVHSIIRQLDEGHQVDAQNPIVQLIRLRQLSLDPRLVGFDVPGAKTETMLDFLENHREPVVVMSMFTSYLKLVGPLIQKLGLKVGYVHGQMSNTEKSNNVEAFQKGRLDVLLCNIISAGVGITLDRSNAVIFTDRAWTPAENAQAEDRVCPTDESRNHAHIVIDVVAEGSVDTRINAILNKKKSLVQFINEGGREAIRQLMAG